MAPHRFRIPSESSTANRIRLTGSDARHIRTVLRLKVGDRIVLFDGLGMEHDARIEEMDRDGILASIQNSNAPARESALRICLAQGLLKDKKMDLIVRQITELGVSRLLSFAAMRSVPRPEEKKLAARKERWEKIALEAAKQCRRVRVPEILPMADFDRMLQWAEGFDLKFAFWEEAPETAFWPSPEAAPESVFLLVGPEGGLTPSEVHRAEKFGFLPVSLGPRILRAETAAVAVCALAQHRYGDLGKAPVQAQPAPQRA